MLINKLLIAAIFVLMLVTDMGLSLFNAAWAQDCAACHSPDGGQPMEEVTVYGIRPSSSAGWTWSSSGWVSPVTLGYFDPAEYPYMEEFQECAQEDMECILSKTNCDAPIDFRRAYASQPSEVVFLGIGIRYDVIYPGFPGTHWETWEIQYIILGSAYIGSVGGCHSN